MPPSPVRWLWGGKRGGERQSQTLDTKLLRWGPTFFRGQRVFLLGLCLLQLGPVEAGHFRNVRLVAHGCRSVSAQARGLGVSGYVTVMISFFRPEPWSSPPLAFSCFPSFVLPNGIRLPSIPLSNTHTHAQMLHPGDGLLQTMESGIQASRPNIYITIDVPMLG